MNYDIRTRPDAKQPRYSAVASQFGHNRIFMCLHEHILFWDAVAIQFQVPLIDVVRVASEIGCG